MGELPGSAVDSDLVSREVDAKRPHLDALLLRKLATAPLDSPDPHIELRGDIRHQDEIIESIADIEARQRIDGDPDDHRHLLEGLSGPNSDQGGAPSIGFVAGLDQHGRRRTLDQLLGVQPIPKGGGLDLAAKLVEAPHGASVALFDALTADD